MHEFRNILVASKRGYDDDATLRTALELAERNGARLTVARVLPDFEAEDYWSDEEARSLHTDVRDELEAKVRALGASASVDVEIRVLTGRPYYEIVRCVLRDRFDLVVLTAQDKEGLRKRLFGSTIMHLMRKCPCAVWVCKANSGSPDRILAAISTFEANDTQQSVNRSVVELACAMARWQDSELLIVQAWTFLGEELLRSRESIRSRSVDLAVVEHKAKNQRQMDRFLSSFDFSDIKLTKRLVKGDPGRVLPRVAASEDVDVIVMGTVCRAGLPGFLIGNSAERILDTVDCSVLAVKPDGFVTPIELERARS